LKKKRGRYWSLYGGIIVTLSKGRGISRRRRGMKLSSKKGGKEKKKPPKEARGGETLTKR